MAGEGYAMVPGVGPNGIGIEGPPGPDGKPTLWHRVPAWQVTQFSPPAVGGTTPDTAAVTTHVAAPAEVPTIAPTELSDTYMHQHFGWDANQPPVGNAQRIFATNPALAAQEQSEEAAVKARTADLPSADTTRRQLVQLSQAVTGLTQGNLAGQGAGSAYRARLANLLTTGGDMLRSVGIPIPQDATTAENLTNQQIIDKIKTLTGATLAHQNNERAASIAHAISGVLPGGDLTPQAANELLSQMLVQSQQPLDFSQYVTGHAAKYGMVLGAEQAYQAAAGPTYTKEQHSLNNFMSSPAYASALADLQSGDATRATRAARYVDKVYGPGFHRYFTGGF